MNVSSILGFVIAGLVIQFGVLHGAKDASIFLDTHALILVVGGTLAASLIAFPVQQLFNLADFLYLGVLFKRHVKTAGLVEQIRAAAHLYRRNPEDIKMAMADHPFLEEGFVLLRKNYLSTEELSAVLESRRLGFKRKYQQDAKVLNAIAKYPPAFGLLGASTGMIAMMTNLGGTGGTAAIGSAMAVALVATFWGIAAANFIFLPLADHAQRAFLKDQVLREMISEGLLMIKEGASDMVIGERLRSMIDTDQRGKVSFSQYAPVTATAPRPAENSPPVDFDSTRIIIKHAADRPATKKASGD